MPEERVFDGTPNDLKPFEEAYHLRQEQKDEEMWIQGQYTLSALMHAMSRLSPKGKKVNYPDKPMLREQAEKRREDHITENEKKNERDNLLMTLQLMQINFNNTHKK